MGTAWTLSDPQGSSRPSTSPGSPNECEWRDPDGACCSDAFQAVLSGDSSTRFPKGSVVRPSRISLSERRRKMRKPAYFILLSILTAGLWSAPQQKSSDHPFANPPMLESRDGRLRVELTVAPATYTIEGHQFTGMLYNGQLISPVWHLRPGDTLTVVLHNKLSQDTNLHFHGMNVSPRGNGDNVFVHIRPGETFTYEVKVPEKHPGLLWFHPHFHGDVDQQIIGGLSGAILIDGSERIYPFLAQMDQKIILFKHHPIGR